MPVTVLHTEEYAAWFADISEKEAEAVVHAVRLLEQMGVTLPHPHSSDIRGSRHAMRELRVKASGKQIRILYAFDPDRQAVLLLGGAKGDDRFYDENVPKADTLWEQYMAWHAQQRAEAEKAKAKKKKEK